MEDYDEFAELNGERGVKLLSKNGNLSINVTNSPGAKITPLGKNNEGNYVYTVVVDAKTVNPKVEVSKRGEVYRTNFVVSTKPNFYRTYFIEEVERPIRLEDQTLSNDAFLDATSAEIEFDTSIEDLKIEISPLLNAQIEKKPKSHDKEILVTSIKIPLENINKIKEQIEKTDAQYSVIKKKFDEDYESLSEQELDLKDNLKDQIDKLNEELKQMTTISVYADGTNKLLVSFDDLQPRMKRVYGVLLLNKVEKVYVTESSAAIAEGSRLYTLRNYKDAKTNYEKALDSPDMDIEVRTMILTNIAECDTCMKVENRLKYVLLKLNDLKKNEATQSELVKYANYAIGDFAMLNNYNPNDFYVERIEKLEKLIADQPLAIHFTVSKWVNDYSGFYEDGRLPNVEIWAFYGNNIPAPKDYANPKAFKKLVNSSSDYKLLGITDGGGEIDIDLDRKKENLPKGFIFYPARQNDNVKPQFLDLNYALKANVDEFNKHQYRMKMYYKQ